MKIGDIIYFINVDLDIDEWKIQEINELNDNRGTLVLYLSYCSNPEERTEVYYDNVNYPKGLWYSDKAVAENYRDEMLEKWQTHQKELRQKVLTDVLSSVFEPTVRQNGKIVETKTSAPFVATLYHYDGENYIGVYQKIGQERKCVLFQKTDVKNI